MPFAWSFFLKHNNALPLSLGGRISNFIVSLSTTAYMSGNAYLGFSAQRNKLLAVYRKMKSQGNFLKGGGKQGVFIKLKNQI